MNRWKNGEEVQIFDVAESADEIVQVVGFHGEQAIIFSSKVANVQLADLEYLKNWTFLRRGTCVIPPHILVK
jgi:hypothetical protein